MSAIHPADREPRLLRPEADRLLLRRNAGRQDRGADDTGGGPGIRVGPVVRLPDGSPLQATDGPARS